MEQDISERTPLSDKVVKTKVVAVYMFLLSGVIITGLTMATLTNCTAVTHIVQAFPLMTLGVAVLLMTFLMNLISRMDAEARKGSRLLCWAANAVLTAIPFLMFDSAVLLKGLIYTTVLVIILSLKSFIIAPKTLDKFAKVLVYLHTLVLACTFYSVIFGSLENIFSLVIVYVSLHGGIIAYSGLFLCNTQRLRSNVKHYQFDPLTSSFVLYLNIINLYTRVVVYSNILNISAVKPEEEVAYQCYR